MILPIVRTAITALRRDRAALALSFILPISFFSIFAVVFGGGMALGWLGAWISAHRHLRSIEPD